MIRTLIKVQAFSRRSKAVGFIHGEDMSEKFMNQCKVLLDNESGRATLPTAFALYLMFATIAFQGKDRIANMFRVMTIEMLKRLKLEQRFFGIRGDTAGAHEERRVISTALWGLFVFEKSECSIPTETISEANCICSRVHALYRQPPFVRPPRVPRLFECHSQGLSAPHTVDILGQPFESSSIYPPRTPGALHPSCDIAVLYYETITYNFTDSKRTTDQDLAERAKMYTKWMAWDAQLPNVFRHDRNFTPQTCCLR